MPLQSPNTAKSYFGRMLENIFKEYFGFEGMCLFVETLSLEQKWEHIGLDGDTHGFFQ